MLGYGLLDLSSKALVDMSTTTEKNGCAMSLSHCSSLEVYSLSWILRSSAFGWVQLRRLDDKLLGRRVAPGISPEVLEHRQRMQQYASANSAPVGAVVVPISEKKQ